MAALVGVCTIVTALVALAGAAKLLDPFPAARALASLGLPHNLWLVRLLGVAELAGGALSIALGGRALPTLIGLLYLGFAGFVALLLRQAKATGKDAASCGCFGVSDTPPGVLHVVINLISGGVMIAGAAVGLDQFGAVVGDQPAAGIPFVAYVLLGTYLTYLVLAVLPEVLHPQGSSQVARNFSLNTNAPTTEPRVSSTTHE